MQLHLLYVLSPDSSISPAASHTDTNTENCVFSSDSPPVSTCPVVFWASGFTLQVRNDLFSPLGWDCDMFVWCFLTGCTPSGSIYPLILSLHFVEREHSVFAKDKVLPLSDCVNGLIGCRSTSVCKRLQQNIHFLQLT